jgi:hypothetical protein
MRLAVNMRQSGAERSRVMRGIVIAGLCSLVGAPASAGTLVPDVALGARFDDRRADTGLPADLAAGVLAPQLTFESGSWASGFGLAARRELVFYRPPAPDASHRLVIDRAADEASLHGRRAWSDDAGVALDARYARTHDVMSALDRSVLLDTDVTQWEGSAAGSIGRAEGDYGVRAWSYAAPRLRNAVALHWSAAVLPVRRPEDAWLAGWRQRQYQIGDSWAARARMAFIGYRRLISPQVSARIDVGAADVQFGDQTPQRGPAVTLMMGPPETAGGGLTSELQLQRELPAGWRVEASRVLGDARLTALWRSGLDVEGGSEREPSLTRRLAIGVQDTLTRSTVIGFDSSFARTRPLYLGTAQADNLRVAGWLARRVRPWLTARGGYSYVRQWSFGPGTAPAFRRIRVDAALLMVL